MPTNYKGCIPKIREKLKKGQHVQCKCTVKAAVTAHVKVIVAYLAKGAEYVVVSSDGRSYRISEASYKIEPLHMETRVINSVAMMEGLILRHAKADGQGDFITPDSDCLFSSDSWCKCGERVKEDGTVWADWMLEDVAVERGTDRE